MSASTLKLHCRISAELYREAAIKASKALFKNWIVPFASIAAYLLFTYLSYLAAFLPGGGGGGFTVQGLILGLVMTALLALYYGWLEAAVKEQKLTYKELIKLDLPLFFSIMAVGFVLWILSLVLSMVLNSEVGKPLLSSLNFGIFVAFNAVCEVIYIQRKDGMEALREALVFQKENWAEWFIPLLLLIAPTITLIGSAVFILLAEGHPLLPPIIFLQSLLIYMGNSFGPSIVLPIVSGVVIVTWFMIFRGFLFQKLYSTSRRQRLYKYRQ